MRYRRENLEGASYFFTVTLENRTTSLLTDHIDFLRKAFITVKRNHPFIVDAIVILPEHLHTLWTLPENDAEFATRWMLIKGYFSRQLPHNERVGPIRLRKGERGIWLRRYWEHRIRDEADWQTHVDYIHFNPVKHGHTHRPADWPFSSFHNHVRHGLLPQDWRATGVSSP